MAPGLARARRVGWSRASPPTMLPVVDQWPLSRFEREGQRFESGRMQPLISTALEGGGQLKLMASRDKEYADKCYFCLGKF